MPELVLTVEDLSVAYTGARGPVVAVEHLNLQVESGSVVGIVGESGAGKTSVGLALAGLLNPEYTRVSGSAIFFGKDLLTMGEHEIAAVRGKDIGMLFQNPVAAFDPTMKVVDQVAQAIMLRGLADGVQATGMALEELSKVGIPAPVLDSAPYAYMLSGGQCQRAQLAATLVGNPQLLIADEPTSSLDTTHQKRVIELLSKRVDQQKIGVIFISHDLPLVSNIADSIVVMNEGRVVESGGSAQVLSRPESEYARELIAASYSPLDREETDRGTA